MRTHRKHRPEHEARKALDLYLPLVSSQGFVVRFLRKPPQFHGAAFTDFLEKHCDDGDVNDCKAIGRTYADNIVYKVIKPADIA